MAGKKGRAKARSKKAPRQKHAPGAVEVLYDGLTADGAILKAGQVVEVPGPQLTAIASEKRTYRGELGARFLSKPAEED